MPIAQAILKSDQTPVCRLCERQTDTGGLNGRPEKREDVRFCCLLIQVCKQAGSLVALDNAFECVHRQMQNCFFGGITISATASFWMA